MQPLCDPHFLFDLYLPGLAAGSGDVAEGVHLPLEAGVWGGQVLVHLSRGRAGLRRSCVNLYALQVGSPVRLPRESDQGASLKDPPHSNV